MWDLGTQRKTKPPSSVSILHNMLRRTFGNRPHRYPMLDQQTRFQKRCKLHVVMLGVVVGVSTVLAGLGYLMNAGMERRRKQATEDYKPVDPEKMYPASDKKIDDEALKDIILGPNRLK